MGLMQRAVETYDSNEKLVGIYKEGQEPLAPIGHVLTNANIEITLNREGEFVDARMVEKAEPKILIPVTEESNGRTSAPAAHPLCDQLKYVSTLKQKEHALYVEGLQEWEESSFGHPFLKSVLTYVSKGSVITDLEKQGVISANDEKNSEKYLVCWRIIGFENEDPACWKNRSLQTAYVQYYLNKISDREKDVCMVEGTWTTPAVQHPKGIVSINGNAKLISANDSSGFTYRGRFSEDGEAASVGYVASQKAHNALRWLASEQGVREAVGNRVFLFWSPQGITIPKPVSGLRVRDAEPIRLPSDYRDNLKKILYSLKDKESIKGNEVAVITAFDAATTGRLAVTYYNEVSVDAFFNRMAEWDSYCCWYRGKFGIQSPSLMQIVNGAFGVQRGRFLETDDRVARQHLQRLLSCKIGGGLIPADIVSALVERASTPLAFDPALWRSIVFTACAAIQKYHHDLNKGGDEMFWDLSKQDRSFQFGRLLAVMEQAEADYYYNSQEDRQTNAIKFMSEYRQRPWFVFERINRQLHQAYLPRIKPWQAKRYEKLVGEICDILSKEPEEDLNKALNDNYLMGYELQRNEFFKKQSQENETEETK